MQIVKKGLIPALLGAAVLAAIVAVVGPAKTWRAVAEAGPGAFLALGLCQLAIVALQTGAWALLNRPVGHEVPYGVLSRATIVGLAVNIVTPSAYLGGEPAKVLYLGRRTGLSRHELAGTILLSKYLEALSFVALFALAAGTSIVGYRHVLFEGAYAAVGGTVVLVTAALVALSAALAVSLVREWRPLTALVGRIARLRPSSERLARLTDRTGRMEEQVHRVLRESGRTPHAAGALLASSHVVMAVRPFLFFALAGGPWLGPVALALLFVASQGLLAIQVTPSGAGTFDGGLLGVFAILGVAAGPVLAFLLAIRLWDAVTVGAGAVFTLRARRLPERSCSPREARAGRREAAGV